MSSSSYRRHRFPAAVTQHAVGLYSSLTLSLRNVEDLLTNRGIVVAYETGPTTPLQNSAGCCHGNAPAQLMPYAINVRWAVLPIAAIASRT